MNVIKSLILYLLSHSINQILKFTRKLNWGKAKDERIVVGRHFETRSINLHFVRNTQLNGRDTFGIP